MDAQYKDRIENVRTKMQEEYEDEVVRAKERERLAKIEAIAKRVQDFNPFEYIQTAIKKSPVVVFSKTTCPYCR